MTGATDTPGLREEGRVSIVVPVYNRGGALLEQALDSILGQDHPDLELIVVDDGSTDSTPELLDEYARRDPRVRTARHANAGQAYTLNRGFEMAGGEFLGYLSSDDLLLGGAIPKLVALLEEDPEAVLAYPAYDVIDAAGATLDVMTPTEYSWVDSVRLQDTIVGPGALFRAEAFRQAGPLRTDLTYLMDMELWLRLGRLGAFARTTEPLAAWRRHGESVSGAGDGRAMAEERLRILDELFDSPAAVELQSVRDEAYRNALILAATVVSPGINTPGERYAVVDLHAREISRKTGSEDSESRLAAARERLSSQQARIRELEREVADLRRRPLTNHLKDRLRDLRDRARGGRSPEAGSGRRDMSDRS